MKSGRKVKVGEAAGRNYVLIPARNIRYSFIFKEITKKLGYI